MRLVNFVYIIIMCMCVIHLVNGMKTERITVLGSPKFKAFLTTEAAREGISVSEFVRRRCEQVPTEDEETLANLTTELHHAMAQAKSSLDEGLRAVSEVLDELRKTNLEKAA